MVHVDDNHITELVVERLKAKGLDDANGLSAFYANNTVPISELPDTFIEVVLNGPISTDWSQFGVVSCSVLIILNVALNGVGQPNTIRESYLYGRIAEALGDSFVIESCHYARNKQSLVYSGRNLYSGYSSKTMSYNVKIY